MARYGDNSAGGPDRDVLTGASSEVSPLFQCYISHYIQVPVKRRAGGFCQQLFPANTLLSQSDDNTFALWRGVKRKLAVAERESMCMCACVCVKEKSDKGWRGGKTEENKPLLCVSCQFSAVQFLLLSSTGNNYWEALSFYLYTTNIPQSSSSYLILIINIFYICLFCWKQFARKVLFYTVQKKQLCFLCPVFIELKFLRSFSAYTKGLFLFVHKYCSQICPNLCYWALLLLLRIHQDAAQTMVIA